jgi:hypothetical protein
MPEIFRKAMLAIAISAFGIASFFNLFADSANAENFRIYFGPFWADGNKQFVAEKSTGVFDEIIKAAANLKETDIVNARKLRLSCLMIREMLDERIADREGLFSAEEAAQAREACRIAEQVIATHEAQSSRK